MTGMNKAGRRGGNRAGATDRFWSKIPPPKKIWENAKIYGGNVRPAIIITFMDDALTNKIYSVRSVRCRHGYMPATLAVTTLLPSVAALTRTALATARHSRPAEYAAMPSLVSVPTDVGARGMQISEPSLLPKAMPAIGTASPTLIANNASAQEVLANRLPIADDGSLSPATLS